MKVIKVLLVDDHELVRAGISALLTAIPGIEVASETANAEDAMEYIASHDVDLALIDISLAGTSGLRLLEVLHENKPFVRIVMLSMHSDPEYVRTALQLGASGYLLKEGTRAELEMAIRSVMEGGTYLSEKLARRLAVDASRPAQEEHLGLTPRQREILKLLVRGRSPREIAHELGISVKTVETHRTQLMDRLHIRNMAGLIQFALKKGLIDLQSI